MILIVGAMAIVFLWRRSKGTDRPRDWVTVAGLVTWRPVRAAAPYAVPLVVLLLCNTVASRLRLPAMAGPLMAVAVLVVGWVVCPDVTLRAACWWDRCRAADRLVRAIVECHVQASSRWLRCPYPMPRTTMITGPGRFLHEVELPPGMDREQLAGYASRIAAAMNVAVVGVDPHPTRPAAWALVHVAASPVEPRRPVTLAPAPDVEHHLYLGDGVQGDVVWDLDDEVGLAVYGAPGGGKGRLARWLGVQWLDERYGRRLTIVDLQGSAEWSQLGQHPRCRLLQFDPRDPAGSLSKILIEVERIRTEGAYRMDLCGEFQVDRWADLPDHVKQSHPRSLLIVDEVTTGLGKPPAADKDETAVLTRQLGAAIGRLYRTVRKNGWQTMHVDQLSYSDTTTLPPGSTAMFGRWVALGGFGPDARLMISGTTDWPEDRAQAGLGVTGRRGASHIDVIGVPDVDRDVIANTLTFEGEATIDENDVDADNFEAFTVEET